MTGRQRVGALFAAGLLVSVAACASDDAEDGTRLPSTVDPGDITTTTAAAAAEGTLPPAGALELEPLYEEELAALGLQLTDRGGLIDRSGGGYVPSAEGRHLALYVEPVGDRTVAEYIDGIRTVAVIFAGDVFERWPGLESFDVCQEPPTADDSRPEPLPVTQIEMTRDEAAAIDFETVTVEDLVRASVADPPGLALRVSPLIAWDAGYAAMTAEGTP